MPRAPSLSGAIAPEPWHVLPWQEVQALLATDAARGLEPGEAAARLARQGANLLERAPRRGPLRILAGQFTDFMVLLLAGAAVLAGVVGDLQDSIAIAAILILNAVLGFVQEHRAERAFEALRALAVGKVRARRGAQPVILPATELVPGDSVLLEAGNLVPADLRLVDVAELRIDESALTGESAPVDKASDPLQEADAPLGDRRNLAYRGTLVVHGRGSGLVVATGMQTELGRIAELLRQETGVRTPLQLRLTRLGRILAIAALALCGLVLGLGLLRGEEPLRMLLTAVSLAVAAVPEALPTVVTLALAFGARRMVLQHVLVRQLPAVETLGSVTFICADKTGTLTENRLQVEALHVDGEAARAAPWQRLIEAMALNNDAEAGADGDHAGDPLEVALYRAVQAAGLDPLEQRRRRPRLAELPFSAGRSRMTTLHQENGEVVAYTKGAPERVLPACHDRLSTHGHAPLDREAVLARVDEMGDAGLRVIAIAYRRWREMPRVSEETLERELTFVGLVGLLDPLRRGAEQAVETCRTAGIQVVMVTGDHPVTARRIAKRLGIPSGDSALLTGPELARLSEDELSGRVEAARIYARVAPEQKISIVRALQARGQSVAMTGDGVNDAPALRRADIGIAMGKSGTDVAREAAHMVLLDDNFESIVAAIRAGRRIYDNIRKFVRYVVTCNAAEIWTLLAAPLLGLPLPLLPIQLLWINLITDGLPGLALAAEPAERGIMRRPPRPPAESVFAHGLGQHVIWVGLLMAAVTLATQAWAWQGGSPRWQSMTFTVLALSQMGHVLAIRSERESLFRLGLLSNWRLLIAVLLTIGLQLATLYVPALAALFRTAPLTSAELLLCFALSSVVFVGVELEKLILRRRARPEAA